MEPNTNGATRNSEVLCGSEAKWGNPRGEEKGGFVQSIKLMQTNRPGERKKVYLV